VPEAATAVLVHGAWHGPWCWKRVTPLLDAAGVPWVAVDLPTCNEQPSRPATLADDAAHVRAAIDAAGGPCIVVGHSYGGAVITEACAGHPAVRRLVYLAAYMLDAGEDIFSMTASIPENAAKFAAMQRGDDGSFWLTADLVRDLFYQDCDADTIAWAAANCRKMRGGGQPVTQVAWRDIPSTYVVAAQDRAILPSLQRTMSARATDVVEWDTSHSPFASRPDLVAELLTRLTRG
jgi:pimeloyl-ACP methyl ester carboxylesterase